METRRMCPNCRAFITTKDRVCPYCEVPLAPRPVQRSEDDGGLLAGIIPHATFVTSLILILNFGLYFAATLLSMKSGNGGAFMSLDGLSLFRFGAKEGQAIFAGQWWRLITAGFLHGGLFHIFLNSWALYDVGANVEQIYGARRFIVIYFMSTVAGFMASLVWTPALSVGASAGLFGLIGAMIAVTMGDRTSYASMLRGFYVRWAIYGLLLGLLPFFRTDNAAHLGGLAAGFLVGWVAGTPRPSRPFMEKIWMIGAISSIAITVLGFVRMYLWFAGFSRI